MEMRRGSEDGKRQEGGGKVIKIQCKYAAIPQEECNYYLFKNTLIFKRN